MKHLFKIIPFILITVLLFSCKNKRLGNATREDKNGWIYVHLSGSPADIGYQHGYLVANEIDTLIKVMQYYLPSSSHKDWAFYRGASKRFIWNKIDKEYQDELRSPPIPSEPAPGRPGVPGIRSFSLNVWLPSTP